MTRRKSTRRRKPRKRAIRKFPVNRSYLHEAEEILILTDLERHGAGPDGRLMTAAHLMRAEPMRYDPVYLPRVLRRMHEERLLERLKITNGFGRGAWKYRIRRTTADTVVQRAA